VRVRSLGLSDDGHATPIECTLVRDVGYVMMDRCGGGEVGRKNKKIE